MWTAGKKNGAVRPRFYNLDQYNSGADWHIVIAAIRSNNDAGNNRCSCQKSDQNARSTFKIALILSNRSGNTINVS